MLLNRMKDQWHGGKKQTGERRVLKMWPLPLALVKNHLCDVPTWKRLFQTLSFAKYLHTKELLKATLPHPTVELGTLLN